MASIHEADFMGALIASVSHDLLNVLATIHQSSGLMDDLMGAGVRKGILGIGMKTEFVHQEKFKAILESIGQQVQRGMVLSEALNALGHAPEPEARERCELWAAAGTTLRLSERLARKRRVRFNLGRQQAPVHAGLGSIWAMMAIHEAMQTLLIGLKDCEIEVLVERPPEGPVVYFKTGAAGLPGLDAPARELVFCERTVRLTPVADGLTLVFPPAKGSA